MILQGKKIKYSKTLASLFSTTSVVGLSILCLLNNLSIDIYSAFFLLKVVLPAALCSWILGNTIGMILESDRAKENANGQKAAVLEADDQAYEIPSMFSMGDDIAGIDDGLDDLGGL